MGDPVAEKSGFLRMYMSSHPDTLVAYAKWYGKVAESVTSAEMSAIDSKSMTLTCKLKDGSTKPVRVEIDPPLAGYEDVKPRLLEMKAIAQEGLGMIKSPVLTTFAFPTQAVLTTTFLPICALVYCTFFPQNSASLLFAPAQFVHRYVHGPLMIGIWVFMIAFHAFEALYVVSLVRKHAGNFAVAAGYVLGTLGFGFPLVMDLRRRIQSARIDSVMKIE
ncbi:DUF2470 domain-containing protein [Mycena chlorophos]|uniref:DUF2470 domain-containing protein n=1 Tax=Mycena chlorophos TaxID=658473 RepID=A0A8H6W760_MYCCL|nr:DUF2470 domain-containing protein [Mycena chlorophos]